MDLSEKDKFGLEKSNGDHLSYHTSAISSDWRFGSDLINPTLGLVSADNPMSVCKGASMDSAPCSSVSMVDSFCPGIWDHLHGSQNLTFAENNLQTSTSCSDVMGIRKGVSGSSRSNVEKAFDLDWNNPNSMSKGGVFVQSGAGILPQSLSQFPADSAFIKRAARFSCFNGGNFTDMGNPFSISGSMGSYSKSGGIQVPELLSGNAAKLVSRSQSQKNELDIEEAANDDSVSVDPGVTEGSSMMKMEREMGNLLRPPHEGKQRNGAVSNESDEAEFSGGGQDEPSNLENVVCEPTSTALNAKKRRRNTKDVELEQVKGASQSPIEHTKENAETKQKIEQNPTSNSIKNAGKNAKENLQNSNAPKEDYIHVRARRGQATNSHSLAERVRREKISERMKFLQDLVPGCSKVTGKAVMLDEIINYVQSLQRQVEFLSMKLAAVNPLLDFNIEGLLSKDILQSRGSTSSTVGFSPDMSIAHPQLHPTHQGLGQAGLPAMGNPSETLRRAINSQLTAMNGYRGPTSQISNAWDDELHSVVQMSFGTNIPFNNQELNGSLPPGHMKVEL